MTENHTSIVLTEVIRILRKGAYDLSYTAPEAWNQRIAGIMQDVWKEAESWQEAASIDYKLNCRMAMLGEES